MTTTLTKLAILSFCTLLTQAATAQVLSGVTSIKEVNFDEQNAAIIQPFWQQQVQQGQLVTANGVKLAYSYAIPANAKATILLVQGRTESMMKYQELMWELSSQGFAVFTMDHRGQGLSDRLLADRHKGHVENFQDYVDDQRLFLEQVVASKRAAGPLFLLTHSMGGAVGSLLMAQQPDLFNAAVLASPMHMPNTELLFSEADGCYVAATLGWMCTDCYAGFVSVPYNATPFADNVLTQSAVRYQAFRQQYAKQPQLQLGGPTWQWVSEACAIADEMPAVAQAVKTPFLILQGGADTVVSNSAQDEFCQHATNSCRGVVKVAGAKHELFIEQDQYRLQAMTTLFKFFDGFITPAS